MRKGVQERGDATGGRESPPAEQTGGEERGCECEHAILFLKMCLGGATLRFSALFAIAEAGSYKASNVPHPHHILGVSAVAYGGAGRVLLRS